MTTTDPAVRPAAIEPAAAVPAPGLTAFRALTGLTALVVLLQGLWAGIFLQHDGQRDAAGSWIDVHARGADLAIALALAAALVGFWKLRERPGLWGGAALLAGLLAAEAYLGGLIVDQSKDVLTAVHVPLAMALMALSVALPLRAGRER